MQIETLVEPGENARLVELPSRIVNHDEAAFHEARHRTVYLTALRACEQEVLAEDVCEEVFWQVWRQATCFEPARDSVVAWVLLMTSVCILDVLGGFGRTAATIVGLDPGSGEVEPAGCQLPSQQFEHALARDNG